MKEDEIIELLKNKKYTKAAEKLYVYFPVVKKLVLKNNGNRQDAEDLYQEALIILIGKTQNGNFVLSSSLSTYLYGVCRLLWHERLRKQNKTILNDPQNHVTAIEDDDIVRDENERRLAEKAFGQLGEKCKQLLLLFYYGNMSLKDIAIRLGFGSEKTAKNQKYRCLEKAKENLRTLTAGHHE